MAYLIVSDIHGALSQLSILLDRPELFESRTPVFLGDFVDVGPDSKGVIERLERLKTKFSNAIFLFGNHDFALLRYLETGDFVEYAQIGGLSTIRSYAGEVFGDVHKQFLSSFPPSHLAFLRSLRSHYETEEYLFSHCGYSPADPEDRSFEVMVVQSHQDLFLSGATVKKLVVCGHYFQRTRSPFVCDKVICLDTGCGVLGGPLTALVLPERQLIQVQPNLTLTATALSGPCPK